VKGDAKNNGEIKVEGDAKGKGGFLIEGGIHIGGKGKTKESKLSYPHHQKKEN